MTGKHILMHKNKKVATCSFDKDGYLKQLYDIHNEEHFPVMAQKNPLQGLQQWIVSRLPGKGRADLARLKAFYGMESIVSPHAASLFDAYWFKAAEDNTTWDDINFFRRFDNRTDGIETLLFRQGNMSRYSLNVDSPNLTIPGNKERYWLKQNNKLYLIYKDAQAEMADYKKVVKNFATIGRTIDLPGNNGFNSTTKEFHQNELLPREYILLNDVLFTRIPVETSEHIERIPLEEYYIVTDKSKNKSKVQNLIQCCEQFKLPNYRTFFSLIADYDDAIGLEERELSDVGVLRNVETLEILGFHKL